jgi:Rieske Fe-S protein
MNSQSAENHPLKADLTRRGALCALATLSLGAVVIPSSPAIAATGVKVLRNGRIEVTIARNPALKSVGGLVRIDGVSGRSIALVRTAKGRNGFTALDLRCTHQGTIVQQDGAMWSCPNHGAAFALDGEVKIGPAETPLRKLRVTATAKKVVIS